MDCHRGILGCLETNSLTSVMPDRWTKCSVKRTVPAGSRSSPAIVLDAAAAPDSLEAFDPILIGFWCDRGRAPEEIERLMPRIRGKRIGFFATMGGDPASPRAQD